MIPDYIRSAEARGVVRSISRCQQQMPRVVILLTFEYTGVATPGLWDFQNVFEHELDEALGITSALTRVANNAPLPPASTRRTTSAMVRGQAPPLDRPECGGLFLK